MKLIKKAVIKVLSQRVLTSLNSRLILCYHDVSNSDAPQHSELYSTSLDNFRLQIEFILKNFKIVSLEEITSAKRQNRERFASITFDDGFLSVKQNALPFLESRGIPFTVFANKMAIQANRLIYDAKFSELNKKYDEKIYLDENDLKELSGKGVLIGNHSSSHKILADCSEQELNAEIIENKLFLEEMLDRKIVHFAIPYGKREHYNKKVLDLCFLSGHRYVYSSNPVCYDANILHEDTNFIPRIGVTNETPGELCFLINRPLLKKIDI